MSTLEDDRKTLQACASWLRRQYAIEIRRRPEQHKSQMKRFADALDSLLERERALSMKETEDEHA